MSTQDSNGSVIHQEDLTYEQAAKVATTTAACLIVQDAMSMLYAVTRMDSDKVAPVHHTGWKIELRCRPTLRLQIRIGEPKLHATVHGMLVAVGWVVRDKGDHLVVIV